MKSHYFLEEEIGSMCCIINFVAWNKMGNLENLSTTTKMESLPFLVLGSPRTKSIEMST